MEDTNMSEQLVSCTYGGCDQQFPTVPAKAKHVKKVHGGGAKKDEEEKTIKCSKCDKYFKKKSYVRMHEKRVHNKETNLEISVNIDESLNQSNASLNSTLALENVGEFSDMASADDTITEESNLLELKNDLVKALSINNTSTPALKEKTFKCGKCDKMFGKKSYVRLHEKRIHKDKESQTSSVDQGNEMLLAEPVSAVTNTEKEENESHNIAVIERDDPKDLGAEAKEEQNIPMPNINDPDYELLALPGSSKLNNPVGNIFDSFLYTSKHPMSRVTVERTGKDDFKCRLCGLKFLTKRSQVKHFKGHGTYVNQDFLTNFIDKENESSLKNMCLRKSSIVLKLPNINNIPVPTDDGRREEEDLVADMLVDHEESEVGSMSLSEICDDLMDISNLLT